LNTTALDDGLWAIWTFVIFARDVLPALRLRIYVM